jgi:hypothetical protein
MILLSSFDINHIILFLGDSDEKFSHKSWTLSNRFFLSCSYSYVFEYDSLFFLILYL